MPMIKISLNLLKIEGAFVSATSDEQGKTRYYVSVPADQLYIPQNAQGQAHLTATLIETPANQFNDFAIRPYVPAARLSAMSEEQRRAIPFIGSGSYIRQAVPTAVTSQAVQLNRAADVTLPPTQSDNDPF